MISVCAPIEMSPIRWSGVPFVSGSKWLLLLLAVIHNDDYNNLFELILHKPCLRLILNYTYKAMKSLIFLFLV